MGFYDFWTNASPFQGGNFASHVNDLIEFYGPLSGTDPGSPGIGDQLDAFRHALMQAEMMSLFVANGYTQSEALYMTEKIGNAHEYLNWESASLANQDFWNNNVGRQAYIDWKYAVDNNLTSDSLQKWVYDRVVAGDTLNDKDDAVAESKVWPVQLDHEGVNASLAHLLNRSVVSMGSEFASATLNLAGVDLARLASAIEAKSREFGETLSDGWQAVKGAWNSAWGQSTPLVLDLDASGSVELAAANSTDAVYFDRDANGFKELGGWATGGDGVLALDVNEDGVINDGTELFGDQTGYANGFLALAQYDTNADNQITSADSVWSDLRVWIDANQDGYSDEGEVQTLGDVGITALSTAYSNVNTTISGNAVKQDGSFTMGGVTHDMLDVYFTVDKANTAFNQDYTLDEQALFLPMLRGYGVVPDLHIAMSIDNTGSGNLLEIMQDFASRDAEAIFTSDTVSDVREIMFRWAGVEGAPARGSYVNSQELAFLEKVMGGETFIQRNYYHDPLPVAGDVLTQGFDIAFKHTYAVLLAQTDAGKIFTGEFFYNAATDELEGITGLDMDVLGDLETIATGLASTGARTDFWSNVVRFIEDAYGVDTLSGGDETALDAAITASDVTLDLTDILATGIVGDTTGETWSGTSGADTHGGTAFDDTISGGNGNDILSGLAGKDELNGGANDDTLNGGDGNDTLNGNAGNDTLNGGHGGDIMNGADGNEVYQHDLGDGDDVIIENGGTDKIVFGAGISSGDLVYSRNSNDDLSISYNISGTKGSVIVQDYFSGSPDLVETVELSGGTTVTLSTKTYTTFGTAYADTIAGIVSNGSTNDTIYGYGGNDTISAGNGTNTVYGGDGNDSITGGTGVDTLSGGAGNDVLAGAGGADIYVYALGDGNDTISETGSATTDKILFGAGISSGDLTYARTADNELTISFNIGGTPGQITLENQFSTAGVEVLDFNGGSTLTLSSLTYTTYGTAGVDTINGISSNGSTNDTIYGYGGADDIDGGSGADLIYGGDGNDAILGNTGDDVMNGGAGDDTINGFNGDDTADYSGASGAAYINLSTSSQTLGGNAVAAGKGMDGLGGLDTLSNIDNVTGGGYDDFIFGTTGTNVLMGGDGADTLYGNSGTDTLQGDNGADWLDGGAGNDTLTGGAGADRFYYATGGNTDTITDYVDGTDTIEFHGISGLTSYANLTITNVLGNAKIAFGAAHLFTVNGVTASQLDSSDFLFT